MPGHYNTSNPEIIICTSSENVSEKIISGIEPLEVDYLSIDTGNNNSRLKEFVTAAASASILIFAFDKHDGFNTRHRQMIKTATVLGLSQIKFVFMETENSEKFYSYLEKFRTELSNYTDALAQTGSGAVSSDVLLYSETDAERHKVKSFSQGMANIKSELFSETELFRFAVETVTKDGQSSGRILSGAVNPGDRVIILPSAIRTSIASIEHRGQKTKETHREQSVCLTLGNGELPDRGDMICNAGDPVEVADQFETTIIWLSNDPMMAGRRYGFKSTTNEGDVTITTLKYLINVDLDDHVAVNLLQSGEIGVCNISLSKRIPFEHYDVARETSQFMLFDHETGENVGIGAIHFALRRASNVHWQALDVTRHSRAELKGQKPAILWFTGLSGSGKSAIANIVEKKLVSQGRHTYTLDGDNIRHGLNRDLGFTDVDRVENIRRIGEVSKLMADSGLICLVSFISPFRSERQIARELAEPDEFIEIHVDTPLEVAEARDVKGLYKKARAGEIKNFTGIDSPYEPPENPEIRVDTVANSAEDAAEIILEKLQSWGKITPV